MNPPTEQTYQELQLAYTHLNQTLFRGKLPECLITMQRKARSFGYFCGTRFVDHQGRKTDEIALNPAYFAARGDEGVLSTLGHEMAHLWQHHFGKAGRRRYHNRQWANLMIDIGLYPSNTGQPGGREIGDQMTHYIVSNGLFDVSCRRLLASGFRLSWLDNDDLQRKQSPFKGVASKGRNDGSNRWKYRCPVCLLNVWAKPEVLIICGYCRVDMQKASKPVGLV